MTNIQLVLLVGFIASLFVVYWPQLRSYVGRYRRVTSSANTSIATQLVDELLAVTELRDKLAAAGYQEGVDACTVLLRVIVEHTQPKSNETKGAV